MTSTANDAINEAHDRARLIAEHDLGIGQVVGPNDTHASDAYERGWDDAITAVWNAAVYAAQEELVRRDQFSERTIVILDELLRKESA